MSFDRAAPVTTAYTGQAATEYDSRRFVTQQGRLFSDLEFEQLGSALRHLSPGARVLELGCGTGRFSEYVARRGHALLATDPSPDMIELASRRCAGLDMVAFQEEEGARLSFEDAAFDFVFAIRVLNQTGSDEYALRMIREMIRVTKGGGLALIEFVNRERPLAKRGSSVRLSFDEIGEVSSDQNCEIVFRHGVLIFSQSLLNRIPKLLVPLWGVFERVAARIFWRWASRGYVLLRKKQSTG